MQICLSCGDMFEEDLTGAGIYQSHKSKTLKALIPY